jgi:hypothetical protein
MKEIKDAQKKWKAAKDAAQTRSENAHDYEYARKLGACQMFTGEESMEEMIKLMFSPQGAEFLTANNFPDIATFRKFKKYHPERFGVYIDCGEIALSDEKKVFLVGNTSARLKYSQTQGNRLILMCGASAHVEASGYSVLKIETDDISKVEVKVSGHAKVMR